MQIQQATAQLLLPKTMRPRILVVDDETMICDLLCIILNDDYEVICAGMSEDALLVLAEQSVDAMLLDYCLPGGSEQVAKRADEIGVPMVWMTGDHTASDANSHPILLKPFHVERVLEVLIEARNSVDLLDRSA